MNFGFNSNVRVGEIQYHVQTEDRGESHPFITTTVYQGGRVVHRRDTDYKDIVTAAGDSKTMDDYLRSLISEQHAEVIALIEGGSFDMNSPARTQSREVAIRPTAALSIRLENPASWLVSGKVFLQVRVLRGTAKAQSAEVAAFVEDETNPSPPCYGRADGEGFAELRFAMPASIGDGASLVIRAMLGKDRGELRFRLKPAKPVPAQVR